MTRSLLLSPTSCRPCQAGQVDLGRGKDLGWRQMLSKGRTDRQHVCDVLNLILKTVLVLRTRLWFTQVTTDKKLIYAPKNRNLCTDKAIHSSHDHGTPGKSGTLQKLGDNIIKDILGKFFITLTFNIRTLYFILGKCNGMRKQLNKAVP